MLIGGLWRFKTPRSIPMSRRLLGLSRSKRRRPPRARNSRSAAGASLLGMLFDTGRGGKTNPEGGRWQGLDVAARSLRCRRWFREFGLIAHTGGAYLQNGPNSSAKAKRPRISNSAAN